MKDYKTSIIDNSGFTHLPVYIISIIGSLVLLFLPDNILEYAWARAYTEQVSNWFGEVRRLSDIAERGHIEQYVPFYVALVLPIGVAVFIVDTLVRRVPLNSKTEKALMKRKILSLLGLVMFAYYILIMLQYREPFSHSPIYNPGYLVRTMAQSKLGMMTLGNVYYIYGMFFTINVLFNIRTVISAYFNRKQEALY